MHALYGPLIQQALAEWGTRMLYLALDTSMWWDTYCLVRIALVYRGRAVPMVWTVLEHPSSSVAYEVDKDLRDKVAELLPGRGYAAGGAVLGGRQSDRKRGEQRHQPDAS